MSKHTYCLMEAPIPLKRGRLFKLAGKTMVYDSQKSDKAKTRHMIWKQHKDLYKDLYKDLPHKDLPPFDGPLHLIVTFHMPIPESLSAKKKQSLMGKPHIKRPDIDNLEKYLLDCLTGLIIKDDSLFYDVHSRKIWSDEPKTIFTIETEEGPI